MGRSIENVIFYKIEKDSNDMAKFGGYARALETNRQGANWEGTFATGGNTPVSALHNRPKPHNGNLAWSTVAEAGCNKYVFRLADDTDAVFKDTPSPVKCFTDHIPGNPTLISKATLVANNCVSFVVDTVDIVAKIKQATQGSSLSFGGGHYARLPLYFNIYDTITGVPVWLAANHSHSGSSSARSHGGVHVGGFVSEMYVAT